MVAAGIVFYVAPSAAALFMMAIRKSLSCYRLRGLGLPRTSREDWVAVYDRLGLTLESRDPPRQARQARPWRLVCAGLMAVTSGALLISPVPTRFLIAFDGRSLDPFPLIQAALAGGCLAVSVVLAFHRPRAWLLFGTPQAEYPYPDLPSQDDSGTEAEET